MLHYLWKIFHWKIINIRMKNEKEGREREMEAVMPMNGFMELTKEDLMAVDGGVNWDRYFAGNVVAASAELALVLAAPEVSIPALILAGALVAGGCVYAEYGIYSD
jgi:hypothetical protein